MIIFYDFISKNKIMNDLLTKNHPNYTTKNQYLSSPPKSALPYPKTSGSWWTKAKQSPQRMQSVTGVVPE
jgi:hypothetical protein